MVRLVVVGALLLAIAALAMNLATSRRSPTEPAEVERVASAHGESPGAGGARAPYDLERRLKLLEAKLAHEAAERQRLEERFEAVAAQLATSGTDAEQTESERAASRGAAPADVASGDAANADAIDDLASPMERALTAAGLDAEAAADMKRRHDAQSMTEMYLRDQATREDWLDSPRFTEEMAALEAQRTSVRDELGDDDAYDRYLFALGESNRVRVDDVMLQSPAAQAGLQTGDVIVRYGDARIFAPGELVAQTRDGTAGEAVRLEIIRNGERLEVEVPRGPLGLRIAASQDAPGKS